jgi:tetratricopeptide (TPR) repeat protein
LAAVGENGDAAKAVELTKQLQALDTKNAEVLNELANVIMTDESIANRDFDLALKFAQNAVAASGSTNAVMIDTYASALFSTGKIAEAIQEQKKAIALAKERANLENPDQLEEMKMKLVTYQAKLKETKN